MTQALSSGDKWHLFDDQGNPSRGHSVATFAADIRLLRDVNMMADLGGVAARGGHLYVARGPELLDHAGPAEIMRLSPP